MSHCRRSKISRVVRNAEVEKFDVRIGRYDRKGVESVPECPAPENTSEKRCVGCGVSVRISPRYTGKLPRCRDCREKT